MSPLAEGSSSDEGPEPVVPGPGVEHGVEPGGSAGADDEASVNDAVGESDEKRRYPSTIGGAFYLVILGVMVAGLIVVSSGHWRGGVHLVAGALGAAALLRFTLPERDAGMLAVRGRWIDGTLLAVLCVLLWVLASSLPPTA